MQIRQITKLPPIDFSIEHIVDTLCAIRGVTDRETFLHPPSPMTLTLDQFGYEAEFMRVIPRIEELFLQKKSIVVYTDYDADGITGGTVMWETLHILGCKVMPYVPHRALEGYGFSLGGIDAVKKKYDPALIISVDHGITAVSQIAYAKQLGVEVIVTDHHHKQQQVPESALGIFHIPKLSGSGVAYVFAKRLYEHFAKHQAQFAIDSTTIHRLKYLFENDFASIASIGTIADLVPLIGPSRQLVSYGLSHFSSMSRPGMTALLKSAGVQGKPITTFEVGYLIAPRINAVGRLEHAIDALRLLCTKSDSRAEELASKIGDLNTDRQEKVKEGVKEAKAMVEHMKQESGEIPKLIVLHSPHWHEGIIGLIASALVEEYYRPAIIMTETETMFKGSARSIVSFHITEYFTQLKTLFINFGGHAQAAGFSISKENLKTFLSDGLTLANSLISDDDLIRAYEVDIELPLEKATIGLANSIQSLQPFGIGNPIPRFASIVELVEAKIMGKTGDHLKLVVQAPEKKSLPFEVVAFRKAALFTELSKGMKLKIAYQLEINEWNGRTKLQGKLLAIEL